MTKRPGAPSIPAEAPDAQAQILAAGDGGERGGAEFAPLDRRDVLAASLPEAFDEPLRRERAYAGSAARDSRPRRGTGFAILAIVLLFVALPRRCMSIAIRSC